MRPIGKSCEKCFRKIRKDLRRYSPGYGSSERCGGDAEKFRGDAEKFREVPRSSEKCVRIGLHHDMRGRCAPGMAANHGKIGLNRGTWGRCAPSMAAKWSHLLLVL